MAHYDCLLVGHNELDFEDYYAILENMAISGGRDHVAFTDLQLNHVRYDGRPHQALEILTTLHNEGLPRERHRTFYNGDCLWTAITYLGSYLAKRGYTFDFVNLFHSGKGELKRKLKENTYELVVLTGTMYVFEQNIWEIVTFIRRHCREARIIAGGPYISKLAEEREPEYLKPLFQYLDSDFYCYAREGEQTLVALVDALKNGTDVGDVPNLAYRNGPSYTITREEREVNPLADNLIDYSLFADSFAQNGWANVRISDGCPYACGFCAFPLHGNERYLHMTLDRIEREFDAIKATGSISHIFFIDATLNVPRRQFREMLEMMIRKEYDFRWHCFFRCDQTDEETVWLMKEAGCLGVFLGLESANATVLKNMDKSAHKEDFRRSLPWFKAAGLRTMVSVLVGFPGETIDTFRETQDFVEELQPDFTRIQPWYCDPTTPVWGKREQFELEGKGYGWKHYTMDSETAVELVVDSFMGLRGVTFVPDPGYNWTSTYMMETLGMPVERQHQFLALFAGTARAALLTGKPAEHEPALLDALRIASQFDRGGEPDLAELEPFSGERYAAARSFWVEEFRGVAPREGGWNVLRGPEARWSAGLDAGWEDVLAAYGRVLDGVEGLDGAILVAPDGEEPFPLRSGADGQKLQQSREHARFAWFVLTHPLTAKEFGVGFPKLPAAFVVGDGGELLDERRARYPELRGEPDVVLTLADGRVELTSATGRFDEAALAALGSDLVRACGAGSLLDDTAVGARLASTTSRGV